MHIVLTICSGLFLILCVAVHHFVVRWADQALDSQRQAELIASKLREERDRVTVLEREHDALRRELRKLSGKFYAMRAELEDGDYEDDPRPDNAPPSIDVEALPICPNWALAVDQGPLSDAAKCACAYCSGRREHRRRQRLEAVPKTVQGQAALAKLNAGKP